MYRTARNRGCFAQDMCAITVQYIIFYLFIRDEEWKQQRYIIFKMQSMAGLMVFFLLGCITFRSNIGYEQVKDEPRIHISEHVRWMGMYGPTIQLEVAPQQRFALRQIALGGEVSSLPIEAFSQLIGNDGSASYALSQMLTLSSIGFHLVHYQFDDFVGKVGIFNPYLNLHSPPLCLDGATMTTTGTCFSAYGIAQAMLFIDHPNEFRWSVGISMHQTIAVEF